jgi:putative membrane protein
MKKGPLFDWRHAAAGALALGLGALATAEEPMKPSRAAQVLMNESVKDFFDTAGSAGQFEVEAGKLAQSLGTSPEVKSFAEKMITDHANAGKELEKIAADKGAKLPVALLKRHQKMLDDLKNESPGKEFDGTYRRYMIVSHKEAVSLFDEASRSSADADVKAFAAKTLPLLQHHGSMAERLPKP